MARAACRSSSCRSVRTRRSLTAGVAWLIAASAVCLSACGQPDAGPLALTLDSPDRASVTGLSAAEASRLRDAKLSDAELGRIFRVRVAEADAAISGRYTISDRRVDFTPAFPFDRGRRYTLEFQTARLQRPGAPPVLSQTLTLAASEAAATPATPTRVLSVDPTADVWPANILRVYIHFSNPMSSETAAGNITLREAGGGEVEAAFVPVEADYFNQDHTRYTLFFDPGRVKRGILPNRQLGRALVPGRRYVLEVSASWHDAQARPLAEGFHREFEAGPAIEKPLRVEDWQVSEVMAGARDPVAVTFPWPIDRALAARALSIAGPDGRVVEGHAQVETGDRRWTFVPASAWAAGTYQLRTEPVLEDVSGNQVNKAFEMKPGTATAASGSDLHVRTFVVRAAR